MLPFYSSAQVDSLLALACSPEYMKDYDMTSSTFVRYIEDKEGSPEVHIWEMAGNKDDHFFVWSFSLPRANFQNSPDGRVALSGKFIAGDARFSCTREFVSEWVAMEEARTEKQFLLGNARVQVLKDSQEMKAWHVKVHERFNYVVELQVDIKNHPNPF
ncbi:hypothetical protein V8C35DRAFT_317919 [Trichoderma chlorosporum]